MLTLANALTLPSASAASHYRHDGMLCPGVPGGSRGAPQVLHVGTFIVRHLVFLQFLIKQLSERLRFSTGDQLKSSGFMERRGSGGKRSSRLREESVCASSGVADQASAVSLATTSAVTFTDEPDCKLVVPFPFFRWTVDPVFHKLAFVP